MPEYYFDTETTGLDPTKNKIITIQWQALNGFTGEPIGELQILKEWESSEKEILGKFLPLIQCDNPWNFIIVGKNLLFDFLFLDRRAKEYGFEGFDLAYCYDRVWLDLKHILVLINKGSFRGYDKVLDVDGSLAGVDIPKLYEQKKYPEVIEYVKKEADLFLKGLKILKAEMPTFKNRFEKLV